jgi:phage-related minor tail protein
MQLSGNCIIDTEHELMKHLPNTSANFPDALRNLAAAVATAAVLGMALMFSAVLVAVIVVAALLGWAYLWWKTRELRKLMRNYPPGSVTMEREVAGDDAVRGEVIEGEAVRVVDTRDEQ